MTKQEKIREGFKMAVLMNVETNKLGDIVFKVDGLDNVFSYLRSQDVVIKVERELPDNECGLCMFNLSDSGFDQSSHKRKCTIPCKETRVAVEPLI